MSTLGLSDGGLSDDGLSDGTVIKSDRIDGILPRGLLMLTLGLAVGIDGDLGKGTYAGETCGVTLSLVSCSKSETHCSRNLDG
jgi:hypothetical protein